MLDKLSYGANASKVEWFYSWSNFAFSARFFPGFEIKDYCDVDLWRTTALLSDSAILFLFLINGDCFWALIAFELDYMTVVGEPDY